VSARLLKPGSAAEWREARRLAEEYAASLYLDLSFQNFAHELEHFEKEYSPPSGAFLLAGKKAPASAAWLAQAQRHCRRNQAALRRAGRTRLGLGEALARGIVDEGKKLKYTRLVLDTLPSMLAARSLYQALGFKPIALIDIIRLQERRISSCSCTIKEPPRADSTEIRAISPVLLRGRP